MATKPEANDSVSVARRRQQKAHLVDQSRKLDAASFLIGKEGEGRTLLFAGTKKSADALVKALEAEGIASAAAHGNLSESECKEATKRFNDGDVRVLVTTDKIAEVMEIDAVDSVIGLHVPADADLFLKRMTYLSDAGVAVTLVGSEEFSLLHAVERKLKRNIPQSVLEGFEKTPEAETAPKPKGDARAKGGKPKGPKGGPKKGGGRAPKSGGDSKPAKKPLKPKGKKIVVKSLEPKQG